MVLEQAGKIECDSCSLTYLGVGYRLWSRRSRGQGEVRLTLQQVVEVCGDVGSGRRIGDFLKLFILENIHPSENLDLV